MMAHLEVVVPPEIVDEESSGETEVEEGSSVNLVCKAKGHPTPRVSWQRERGERIVLRDQGAKKVSTVEGEILNLTKVKRQDMGPYLCIANNKIPPSVSKRIMLRVNFKPVLDVPHHMFGSPFGNDVTIKCKVESSPKAVNTWRKVPGEQMIISSSKYDVINKHEGYYITVMSLTIKNFTQSDATNYVCSSSNSLGYSESTIQVYEIPTPKIKKADEEDESANENVILKNSKEKISKNSLTATGEKKILDKLVEPFPSGGKKGMSSEYSGGKHRLHDGQKDMLEGSSEDETAKQIEDARGDVFTFFNSKAATSSATLMGNVCVLILLLILNILNQP